MACSCPLPTSQQTGISFKPVASLLCRCLATPACLSCATAWPRLRSPPTHLNAVTSNWPPCCDCQLISLLAWFNRKQASRSALHCHTSLHMLHQLVGAVLIIARRPHPPEASSQCCVPFSSNKGDTPMHSLLSARCIVRCDCDSSARCVEKPLQ